MAGTWADECLNYEPDPKLEGFYTLAAFQLGDPHHRKWIEGNAKQFYALYRSWGEDKLLIYDGAAVMLQYILWYERNRPQS